MQRPSLIVYLFLFLTANAAFSQEEAPKVEKEYSGKQSFEWEKIQMELATIKGKLESQTALVKNIIVAKNQLKGEALDLKLEELKKEYQRLQQLTTDYNKLNVEYLTKFPERGTKTSRIYKRIKPKSIQAIENELTVQGRINRLHAKILSQYPGKGRDSKKSNISTQPEIKSKVESSKKPESDNVTDQIHLKK